MTSKRKRRNDEDLLVRSALLSCGISSEVLVDQVLAFLPRKANLQVMSVERIAAHFILSKHLCKTHGTRLQGKSSLCEDCEQAKVNKRRCDECNQFNDAWMVPKCDFCGLECCYICAQACDLRSGWCYECDTFYCSDCRKSKWPVCSTCDDKSSCCQDMLSCGNGSCTMLFCKDCQSRGAAANCGSCERFFCRQHDNDLFSVGDGTSICSSCCLNLDFKKANDAGAKPREELDES